MDKAASYLAEEYKQSVPLVRELIKTYESMLEEMPKGTQERLEVLRKTGWVWLCLATLCQNALAKDASLYEAEKMMEEAYEKSRICFNSIVDRQKDDNEAILYILAKTKKPSTA
jgi:hypothetical protein